MYPPGRPVWTISLRPGPDQQLSTRYFRGYDLPAGPAFLRDRAALATGFDYLGDTGLLALSALLDPSRSHHLQTVLTGGDSARLGDALFDILFPVRDEQRWRPTLNTIAESRPGVDAEPTRHPLRIRIVTTDPVLAGLPWRMTSFQGKWLLDHGWTFEVTSVQAPIGPFDLVVPCGFLVLAPEYEGAQSLKTDQHLLDLRTILDAAAPQWQSSGLVQVAKTRVELSHWLKAMAPAILYFYGHAQVRKEQLCLDLGRGAEPLSMDELNRLLRQDLPTEQLPRLAYLNACTTAASGWSSAGHQLGPEVRLVLTNRTPVFSTHAAATAQRFFIQVLAEKSDPVVALHTLGDDATRRDYQWAVLCLHSSYGNSQIDSSHDAPPDEHAAKRLDRVLPKAAADAHVTQLLASKDRRVDALVAYAEPRRMVHRFSWQACDYLRRDKKHPLHYMAVRFPTDPDPSRLPQLLDEALREVLKAAPTELMGQALRRSMPQHARVLWLEWTREQLTEPVPLTAWLRYCCDTLARACPDSLRVIAYLGIELAVEDHLDLVAAIDEQHVLLNDHQLRFGCAALPVLPGVTLSDLVNFFTNGVNTTCPPGKRHDAARLVFARSRGDYQEAVDLIEQGAKERWTLAFFESIGDKSAGGPPAKSKRFY